MTDDRVPVGQPHYSPNDLRKKTVRIPPQEVVDGASPQMRWLMDEIVAQQHDTNEIKGAVITTHDKMSKGFIGVNDRLDKVNGRVGKNEEQVNNLRVERENEKKERTLREQAIKDLAKATAEKRKADEAYRARVFGYLKWILGLVVIAGGSQMVNWLCNSTTAIKAVLVLVTIAVALLIGIFYGRQRKDILPLPEGDDGV